MPPHHLQLDLPKHVMRNVSRFRLRAHTLAVESFIWRDGNGRCDKCSCAAVQNEVHVLFHCQDLFARSLRRKWLFPLLPFLPILFYGGPLKLLCLVRLSLPSQTVFDFLSQRHNRLCHFISDIMDYSWLAKTGNKPISLTTWLAVTNPLNLQPCKL